MRRGQTPAWAFFYLGKMQPTTFAELSPAPEEYELFDLDLSDGDLNNMLIKSLQRNIDHWDGEPFSFGKVDDENVRYLLGEQFDRKYLRQGEEPVIDNRMFTATRAVLAYVNARVATPEVAPSGSDKHKIQFAKDFQHALYQHGVDNMLNRKAKAATKNLVVRKRAFLKLRFDPNQGAYGDIIVETIDPADIIVDRFATYLNEPNTIYHRQRCTVEELISKFPKKKDAIQKALGIKRGVFTQRSQQITYYETWFGYYDKQNVRRQGLAWFLPQGNLVLGKMQNPNWIYTGDDVQDKLVNFSSEPIKPFITFNYLNNGKSYLDETSLFDQARPQQKALNKRSQQVMENADYVNGRWVADSEAMSQDDATKFINKNPKTIALVKSQNRPVKDSINVFDAQSLPNYVENLIYDHRNEIDQIMGTPNIFRGQQQSDANTLGENILIKQQAGALQDDLATSIDEAMTDYYRKLAQMMKVYYTEDHWFQIKGDDGKFDFVMLNGESLDGNVKISVEAGSTLPNDKQEMRAVIIKASEQNRIDNLSYWEGMIYGKLPDPETIVERLIKETNDPATYLQTVEQEAFNRDADVDLTLLINNKAPVERDDYPQGYLEHFNKYVMSNAYTQLAPDAQQRITAFLGDIAMKAMRTADLGATQEDDAMASGQTEAQVMEEDPALTMGA